MNLTVYEATIPQFMLTLKALTQILEKAKTFAETKKIEPQVLLASRLAPDMFPLCRQVQIVTDLAKGGVQRLTTLKAPIFEDTEQTLPQLVDRIHQTMNFLESVKPEHFKDYEAAKIEFPWNPGKYLNGKDFLIQHWIPNFFFHVTATYAILRENGVELGKGDFLGNQSWKTKA